VSESGDPRVITAVELDPARRLVALTFDDGPSDWTPEILDVLRGHGAHATFFVLGRSVPGREAIVRRTAEEGHELGNHLLSHRSADHLGEEEIREELSTTSERVLAAAGRAPRVVRPPYGADCDRVAQVAATMGLGPTFFWSLSSRDWRERRPEPILERILGNVVPGSVLLFHDHVFQPRPWNRRVARGVRSRRATVAALPTILENLRSEGFDFVSVSQLLEEAAA
jgi:peptidoglycan/xylan/chitin deacetylase (PgdA/CDA1 family)